jgi:hypothetical protein
VTIGTPFWLTAAAGLSLALPLPAQEPARFNVESAGSIAPREETSVNQQLANAIAGYLRQSGRLHHYAIDVVFQDGTAELSGTVADQAQHEEALRLVRSVPGVERVIDHVTSPAESGVMPVQAASPTPESCPLPPDAMHPSAGPFGGTGPYGANQMVEPQPVFQAPAPGPYDLNPPKMPPYAWPTYAPYNNYSRVAYPELYPHQSWPFIGPLYPFPKVPLGWRAVKLEWQDGHWWLSRYATPHDWWKLRYW